MKDRWDDAAAPRDPLEQLIYQSRLVGAEDALVLWGGGNNSVKLSSSDPAGNPLDVMFVKGSGSDMKSIAAAEYAGVRLDYVRALMKRESMSDEEMVDFLARSLVDPKSRRPSIETLLHGFLPAAAVLHTHADAILAVTNVRGREKTVRECFGDAVVVVPYLRPGFALSKQVSSMLSSNPSAPAIILMNHGLITWGDSPAHAYRRHIELVTRAEEFVGHGMPGGASASRRPRKGRSEADVASEEFLEFAPRLRGALSRHRRVVLEFDGSAGVLDFVNRPDLREVAGRGAATPDHLLYTKRYPMIVARPAELEAAMKGYADTYAAYFQAHASAGETMQDPLPRVILVPGAGMWTAGKDARAARIVHDIYRHTMEIMTAAENRGGFTTLSDRDAYEAEYWPLELYKLTLLPKDKELAGQVVLVTGAAGAIGRAICRRLAGEGAHVMVTDLRHQDAELIAESIRQEYGLRRATALALDVTDEQQVHRAFEQAVLAYGGVDVVVSNAGISHVSPLDELDIKSWDESLAVNTTAHFLVTRETLRLMKRQAIGGSIVFVATKNVTAPGKDFGAYSVSKAAEAQLCRIAAIEGGEFGIRANMINPDAVFAGSGLWSEEVRQRRAVAHGVRVENLPEFYRQRNLLKAEVTPDDVAEAALFLAGSRSAKTTGAMIPVDGGLRDAFPR